MKKIFLVLFTTASLSVFSQQGKDGSPTISASTVVNSYTTLSADAAAGASTISVAAVVGLPGGGVSTLTAGDLIMIVQMQGAVTNVVSPSFPWFDPTSSGPYNTTYGGDTIIAGMSQYNNAGNNEYAEISSVSGTTLTLSCVLKNNYLIAGKTQIVRVPRYTSLTISASGIITCPQWTRQNGYGGVIALEVHGNTTIAAGGKIDASGLGFRGGSWLGKNTAAFGSNVLGTTTNSAQAINKGESIAGDTTVYATLQAKYGKGAIANGGGGGCSNNSGGGGGANGGVIASWTGNGNPDNSVGTYTTAWNKEAAGFSATTSSGGGRGGYSYSKTNTDPTLFGPGDASWSSADQRRNVGGFGGHPLDYSTGKLFLGGGGGSGDGDNNYQGSGGNGGGLIYFLSYGTITGSGQINANGADGMASSIVTGGAGSPAGRDGAGGAGGGGAIVVNSTGAVSGISISANGGKGGDQLIVKPITTTRDAYGPGGGGGGGYVGLSSTVAVVPTVNGGSNGIHNYVTSAGANATGNNLIEGSFPPNGATKGGVGGTGVVTTFSIATTGATICSGTTAVLTAALNGTVPGSTTINWYTASTGGSPIATGTSYTTATLSSNTTYYVGTCPGVYREPVTVTITAAPAVPTVTTPVSYCQNATASSLSATAGAGNSLLWWGTASSGGSSSGTATVPSTATVGSTTYYVSQTNGSCGGPRESIVVNITNPPSQPTTAPVSYCQNATPVALTATPSGGNTLLWWGTNSSGGSSSGSAPTPSTATVGTTTYYVSETTGSCESSRSSIVVTINALPSSPTVTTPISYCQNATTSALSATAAGGNSLLWWGTSSSGGSSSASAPTPSTATVGSTTYYVSQTNGTCESSRASIVVNITNPPAAPTVTTPINYCQNAIAASLSATAAGGNSLLWWGTASSGGSSSGTATVPSTATAGSTTYYVSQTTGTCEGPRASIVVNINNTPTAPTTAPISYCQNASAVALTATPSGGNTLLWWGTNSSGGVSSGTAPTPSTATIGTTTYYVSETTGTCEGSRSGIVVTINALPAPPAVTDSVSYCQNQAATQLTPNGAGINWYTTATGGVAGAAPTPSTVSTGVTTYYVSQTVSSCESARDSVKVVVNTSYSNPTAADPTYCVGDVASQLSATGTGTLNWYTVSFGGSASVTAPTPSTASAGTTSYYVSQGTGSCESSREQVDVLVNAIPALPTSINATYCVNDSPVVLSATGAGTLNWYTVSSGGSASATAPTPSTASAGTTSYYVSQTQNGCESGRTQIDVVVNAIPATPTVIDTISYCQNSAASALTATGAGTLNWYAAPTGGTASGTAPTPSTSSTGITSYYVSQTVNGCESNRDTINVVVNSSFLPPSVSNVTYCENDPASALNASGTSALNWYAASSGGTASSTAPTPVTSVVGTTSYFVSQGSGSCESNRAQIDVIVNATPSQPLGSNIAYCMNSSAAALTATGAGTLNWYTALSGGTGSTTAPTPSTSAAGITSYYVSQTINGCESSRDQIDVTVNAIPSAPSIIDTINYCQNSSASALTATGAGTLNWYTSATGGTASAIAPTPSTSSTGITSYYVSQTVNSCESERDTINVVVNSTLPAPSVSNVNYCENVSASVLTATGTSALNWYAASSGGTASATAPTPSTATTGTTSYFVSQGSGSCESNRAQIDVVVAPTPLAPTGTDVTYCLNESPVALTASGTGTLNWYTVSTGGVSSGTAPTPSTGTVGNTDFYVSQTIGVCEGPRDVVSVSVINLQSQPTVGNVDYCIGVGSSALTATGTSTLNWWGTSSSGGTSSVTAPTPSTASAGTTSYYVSQGTGACESPRALIDVIVHANPTISFTQNTTTICASACIVFTENVSVTGVSLSWNFGDGNTGTGSTPTNCYANAGTYNVSVVCTSAQGCVGSSTVNNAVVVSAGANAQISVNPGTTVTLGETISFLADTGLTQTAYTWSFADPTSGIANASTLYNPSHLFGNVGTYCVTLTAGISPCTDNKTVCVEVIKEAFINIPNVFTPNNDGLNDLFTISSSGITSIEGSIFDRWGLKLFSWSGLASSWDGRSKNGATATDGVYYYIIQATDYKNETKTYSGYTQLLAK